MRHFDTARAAGSKRDHVNNQDAGQQTVLLGALLTTEALWECDVCVCVWVYKIVSWPKLKLARHNIWEAKGIII